MAQNIERERRKFLECMSETQQKIQSLFSQIALGEYQDANPDSQELFSIYRFLNPN